MSTYDFCTSPLACCEPFDDLYQLQLREEDSNESEESYEDVNIGKLRYQGKNLADSENLSDGYVHLVKNKENKENNDTEDVESDKKETRKLNEYGVLCTDEVGFP